MRRLFYWSNVLANIRISSLPNEATPSATDELVIDGTTTRKTTIENAVKAGRPVASQPEAEAGIDNLKAMTPLTTKQAIDAIGGSQFATTAQGAKADTALQPANIGTSVQAYDALLDSVSGLTLAAGDLFYATGANTVARLPAGANGSVLAMEAGLPAWASTLMDAQTVDGVTPGTTGLAVLGAETQAEAFDALGISANGSPIDLIRFGLVGDGSDESAAFASALAAAEANGSRKVVCSDPSRTFLVVETKIPNDIEIDLGGATLLGDFGHWGQDSEDSSDIYWTKNIFYSEAIDAPSITLRNMTINGQNDYNQQMAGGTPLLDFNGGASPNSQYTRCGIILDNVHVTRGSNRIYTVGSGIPAPTAILDYRNAEVLIYNADTVIVKNSSLRSSPGEMLQVQSDDARTLLFIEDCYFTKARDQNPASKWSSSALNVFNVHPASEMRRCHFFDFIKGATNLQTDGFSVESCTFDTVDDSNGVDFCEAASVRHNMFVVRNCYFKNISNVGIRLSASNTLLENNTFNNVSIPVSYEGAVSGSPTLGSWVKVDQTALYNNIVRNNSYEGFDVAHAGLIGVRVLGASASLPIHVTIDGGSTQDRPPATNRKPLFGIYAEHAHLTLKGYHAAGRTALVYVTGTSKVYGDKAIFAPEDIAGDGAHVFELNGATLGPKSIVLDECSRIGVHPSGWYDFRNTSSTIDLDAIHLNNSPDFPGTTNNAVVARNGVLVGTSSVNPPPMNEGQTAFVTVTVTGARLGDAVVGVAPAINTANFAVGQGMVTANNTVTIPITNISAGASADLGGSSFNMTACVRKLN